MSRKTVKTVLIVASLALAIGGFRALSTVQTRPVEVRYETAKARITRFVRKIPAAGEVGTYRPTSVYSEVRRWEQPQIIDIVPQGQWVEKGDIVCRLDASNFRDELVKPVLGVIADDARLAKAQANEILQSLTNEQSMESIRRAATSARMRLKAYENAESENEVNRLLGAVATKEEALYQVQEDVGDKRRLASSGIIDSAALQRSKVRLRRSQRELELAEDLVELTKRFNQPRELILKKWNASDSQEETFRASLRGDLALTLARFQTLSFRKYRGGWQQYADSLTTVIDACEMRAPQSGQVVYANKDDRRIEIGSRVHYKQHVFSVINRERMTVDGKVSERYFYALRNGQDVTVRIDAVPGHVFHGVICWMARFAEPLDKFIPHVRFHRIQVLLDDNSEITDRLFPGMTSQIKVTVDDRPNILQVPMDAVFEHHGEYAVLVKVPGGMVRRVVEIGIESDEFMEIITGIESGEEVIIDSAENQRELADKLIDQRRSLTH